MWVKALGLSHHDTRNLCDLSRSFNVTAVKSCGFSLSRWFSFRSAFGILKYLYAIELTRGYMGRKLQNNMECEIFQVLLEEANESYAQEIVRALPSNTIEDMSNNVEILSDWIRAWSPPAEVTQT